MLTPDQLQTLLDDLTRRSYAPTGPHCRRGQALFNYLAVAHPELAEKIRATEADCFYDDKKIPAFLDRIFELCYPAE